MDERRLKASDMARAFHVAEQTIHHWRSSGIPARRQAQVAEWIAERERGEFGDSIDSLRPRAFVLEGTREEFDAWQRAALSEGKIFDEWVHDGLIRLARERGYAAVPNSVSSLALVTEEGSGFHSSLLAKSERTKPREASTRKRSNKRSSGS